jgi:hypothetical protein
MQCHNYRGRGFPVRVVRVDLPVHYCFPELLCKRYNLCVYILNTLYLTQTTCLYGRLVKINTLFSTVCTDRRLQKRKQRTSRSFVIFSVSPGKRLVWEGRVIDAPNTFLVVNSAFQLINFTLGIATLGVGFLEFCIK